MKILFLTDNYWPEANAPASRTTEHCRLWVKAGAEITIITCAPNFPSGKVFEGYRNALWQEEYNDGVRIIRVWSYMTANAGFTKRLLDFLSFALTSFFAGLFVKTDIIIATSPQFFTTWSGWALAKLKRKPWIFELRDLWPESVVAVGLANRGWMFRQLEKIELALYRSANVIIALTDAFKANLVGRGIVPDKIEVVTNGVDLASYQPIPKDNELVKQLGIENKFVVGYIGTHGMAHGLHVFLDVAAKALPEGAHLLFVGEGAERERIVARARELNLKNVTLVGQVPKAEVQRYLMVMDAALIPLVRSDTFLTVIPSKMFEAAAMKKPILLGVDGQARAILEATGAGMFFPPEDGEAFVACLGKIMKDRVLFEQLQQGCAAMAHDYDRRHLATRMLAIVHAAVHRNGDVG